MQLKTILLAAISAAVAAALCQCSPADGGVCIEVDLKAGEGCWDGCLAKGLTLCG